MLITRAAGSYMKCLPTILITWLSTSPFTNDRQRFGTPRTLKTDALEALNNKNSRNSWELINQQFRDDCMGRQIRNVEKCVSHKLSEDRSYRQFNKYIWLVVRQRNRKLIVKFLPVTKTGLSKKTPSSMLLYALLQPAKIFISERYGHQLIDFLMTVFIRILMHIYVTSNTLPCYGYYVIYQYRATVLDYSTSNERKASTAKLIILNWASYCKMLLYFPRFLLSCLFACLLVGSFHCSLRLFIIVFRKRLFSHSFPCARLQTLTYVKNYS
uniref:DDE_Tnp_1_7 domain-containing protein n=1 Tax=Heterorhabditis bacteriophora TaxID=37862 RepID=A0A1I7WQN6_HETBA